MLYLSAFKAILEVRKLSYGMYALTTSRHIAGNTMIFCPGVAKRVAQMLGDGFYAMFSRGKDCMVMPNGFLHAVGKPPMLDTLPLDGISEDMLRPMAATAFHAGSGLSPTLYKYNLERDRI